MFAEYGVALKPIVRGKRILKKSVTGAKNITMMRQRMKEHPTVARMKNITMMRKPFVTRHSFQGTDTFADFGKLFKRMRKKVSKVTGKIVAAHLKIAAKPMSYIPVVGKPASGLLKTVGSAAGKVIGAGVSVPFIAAGAPVMVAASLAKKKVKKYKPVQKQIPTVDTSIMMQEPEAMSPISSSMTTPGELDIVNRYNRAQTQEPQETPWDEQEPIIGNSVAQPVSTTDEVRQRAADIVQEVNEEDMPIESSLIEEYTEMPEPESMSEIPESMNVVSFDEAPPGYFEGFGFDIYDKRYMRTKNLPDFNPKPLSLRSFGSFGVDLEKFKKWTERAKGKVASVKAGTTAGRKLLKAAGIGGAKKPGVELPIESTIESEKEKSPILYILGSGVILGGIIFFMKKRKK